MKYIDAEKLKAEIQRRSMHAYEAITADEPKYRTHYKLGRYEGLRDLIDIIDSLQQDETQVDIMLCSQVWWEEQGWIMIPPDATVEGIDSLLKQVRKKLQQKQPKSSKGKFVFPKFLYARTTNNKTIDVSYAPQSLDAVEYIRNDSLQQEQPKDVSSEIAEYFGEDIPFEDERTKAAYHFFSAGKAFELREYEEERKKHITDLLDNFQKGMNAGYEKAISELKEGKVECSPVMKELIDKLFGIGNTFNFGFGPKTLQQELPDLPGIEEPGIPGKDYIPVDWVDACEMYGKWKIVKQEQPEIDLENELDEWVKYGPHTNYPWCTIPDAIKITAEHFYELGLNARKL